MSRVPSSASSWKWTALVSLVIPLCAPWAGCSAPEEFAADTKYSPESLADELVFRFKDLGADAKALKTRTALKASGKAVTKEKPEEQQKSAETTKKQAAPASSADQILDETVEKIQNLPGVSPAEACTRMAAAVRKSNAIPEADREALAKRLEQMAGK